jgi:hypothetical protein
MQRIIVILCLILIGSTWVGAEEQPEATLYKQPFCGCCDGHADHLRANGYKVTVVQPDNMSLIKKKFRVPQEYEGCHTTIIGGYVIEGHVPATIVRKLLKERPPIRGISLPGMPDGSPGMTGQKTEPFVVYEFGDSGSKVYAQE